MEALPAGRPAGHCSPPAAAALAASLAVVRRVTSGEVGIKSNMALAVRASGAVRAWHSDKGTAAVRGGLGQP